jgi:hypothetical protein
VDQVSHPRGHGLQQAPGRFPIDGLFAYDRLRRATQDLGPGLDALHQIKLIEAIHWIVVVTEGIPHANTMAVEGTQLMGPILPIPGQQDSAIGLFIFGATSRLVGKPRIMVGTEEAGQVGHIRTLGQGHA